MRVNTLGNIAVFEILCVQRIPYPIKKTTENAKLTAEKMYSQIFVVNTNSISISPIFSSPSPLIFLRRPHLEKSDNGSFSLLYSPLRAGHSAVCLVAILMTTRPLCGLLFEDYERFQAAPAPTPAEQAAMDRWAADTLGVAAAAAVAAAASAVSAYNSFWRFWFNFEIWSFLFERLSTVDVSSYTLIFDHCRHLAMRPTRMRAPPWSFGLHPTRYASTSIVSERNYYRIDPPLCLELSRE